MSQCLGSAETSVGAVPAVIIIIVPMVTIYVKLNRIHKRPEILRQIWGEPSVYFSGKKVCSL